jgi:2-methylisocitrate lyase-like PEP mutase family enzyme
MPNPWDAGSARVLTALGFTALATSSGAAAATLGRRDGALDLAAALAHARAIVEATPLPVSADLENGFGDQPEDAAEAIRRAADSGLVGASIEDARKGDGKRIYDFAHAVERVAAAAAAARALPFPFVLTARAENFLRGNPDLDDTIKRLEAFARAGADVLFAPRLPTLAAVRAVTGAVSKPVNFMVNVQEQSWSIAELTGAGVKRVSFASSLYRAALSGLIGAAREVRERGTLAYLDATITVPDLTRFMRE